MLALASAARPAVSVSLPGDPARPAIRYTLTPRPPSGADGAAPSTRVEIVIGGNRAGVPVHLAMPVWTPGEYRLQNHARYVRGLRVTSGAAALAVSHPASSVWVTTPPDEAPIVASYDLPNTPPGIFTENVDVRSRTAFYNGSATFLYVVNRTAEPVELTVRKPEGWQDVLAPLDRTDDGVFTAPDYDALVDAPILIGDRVERRLTLAGRDYTIAYYGNHRGADYSAGASLLRSVAEAATEYMGGAPYERYVLFLDMDGRGGGLEHANAARIAVPKGAWGESTARFVAHEFFHLWNVKRIRPVCLGPFDYSRGPETPNLWFCEGVTEYVAGALALRAGLEGEAHRLDGLSQSIAAWSRTSWRRRVTADAASRKIWSGDWGSSYGGVSIYLSGEMIGLCLDLRLLHVTGGRAGLREVLRDMMARYAPPKPGYGDDGIRDAVMRAGGPEMGPFYDRLCRTMQELPIKECLGYVGLTLDAGGGLVIAPGDSSATRSLRRVWLYGK